MSKRDYYDVLGVSKSATKEEIRKAYRTLSKKFHPDLNKEADAELKFKEVTEAFEVLSDENKRAEYELFGHNGPAARCAGFGGVAGEGFGFEDLVSTLLDGSESRRYPNAPQ